MRLCAALLVIIGSVALVACGDGDASDTSHSTLGAENTTATPSEAEQSTAETEVSPTADPTTSAELQAVEATVDALFTAFAQADSDTASGFFTEDGVWVDKNRDEWIGTSAITVYVEMVGPGMSRCERTGPAEMTADRAFAFPVEFTWNGVDYQDVAVITMTDDLIGRLDWQPQP